MRKILVSSVIGALLLSGCGAASFNAAQPQSEDPSRFIYTRIYCTPDTETHFANVTIELAQRIVNAPPAPPIYVGGTRPASSVFFTGREARWGTHDLETRL